MKRPHPLRKVREAWREATPKEQFSWFTRVLVCVIGLALVITLGRLDDKIDRVQNGDTPATVNQRQARAKLMFNTCAKDATAVEEDKLDEFLIACEPYATLACAYKFEDVPIPAAQRKRLKPCTS